MQLWQLVHCSSLQFGRQALARLNMLDNSYDAKTAWPDWTDWQRIVACRRKIEKQELRTALKAIGFLGDRPGGEQ